MARQSIEEADETDAPRPRDGLFIRVYFGDGRHLGPGMIELLETIRSEHSILSAARRMGMSYRRAWLLVDEIARNFREPIVETYPGRRGHGTDLTPFGERLIALYREVERASAAASAKAVEEMRAALAPPMEEKAEG
ncbi:putative transcriptional regulator, ModE family [Ancylobacter novellus DSM 506]|uniref:Transcriptional regulator, ModE family n=1 Tax=Ancylobacter novellus (strain ATCC 8093 / DSM 506 / JCM 20403 / CCM 1077 / IAM 12100 / NBRC 12443 / NCIMB 10456) TaxID=639283 RepID=D7A4I1_ANCN5|nr:LysR family transcriptional regulator [Ancylobacter novellus]ADH89844.1 putative transcriptional regulator, ModE family [Ancylobacter novellus DSM 506]